MRPIALQRAVALGCTVALAALCGTARAAEVASEIRIDSPLLDITVLQQETAPAGPLADSASHSEGPGAVASGEGSAACSAETGRLRARAHLRTVAGAFSGVSMDAGSRGTVAWYDVVTIGAPGLAGTIGSFVPRMQLAGALAAEAFGSDPPFTSFTESQALASFAVDTQVPLPGKSQQRSRLLSATAGAAPVLIGDPFGSWTLAPVPFEFGTPFPLSVRLDASLFARTVENGSTEGTAEVYDTLSWRGIVEVRDGQGAPLSSFEVASESGFDYLVPEPGGAPLAAALALLALGPARRRRA